jgi:hypothetical protein
MSHSLKQPKLGIVWLTVSNDSELTHRPKRETASIN